MSSMNNPITNLFVHCTGANTEILALTPTEVGKFTRMGAMVLATSIAATGAMFVAVDFSLPGHTLEKCLIAAFWGGAVFAIDSYFVATYRRPTTGRLGLAAVARIAGAVLVGAIISEPLTLWYFRGEIESRITQNQAADRASAQQRIGDTPKYRQINDLEAANKTLEAQLQEKEAFRDQVNQSLLDEGHGKSGEGLSGRAGKGPLFAEEGERLAQAKEELATLHDQVDPQLHANESRVAQLEQERDQELAGQDTADRHATGLLARTHALDQIISEDPGMARARWGIFLVLLFIDVMPVLMKISTMSGKVSPYEAMLESAEAHAIEEARIRTADAHAEADLEIAVNQARMKALRELEVQTSSLMAASIAQTRQDIAQAQYDAWKWQMLQSIPQPPAGVQAPAVAQPSPVPAPAAVAPNAPPQAVGVGLGVGQAGAAIGP